MTDFATTTRRQIIGLGAGLLVLGVPAISALAQSKRPEGRGRGSAGGDHGTDHGSADDHASGDDHGDDHAGGHDSGGDSGDDHDHADNDDHGAKGRGKGPKYRGGRPPGTVPGRRGHSLEQTVFKTGAKRWVR